MHSTSGGGWRLKGLMPLCSIHDTTSFSNRHPWDWVNCVNLKIVDTSEAISTFNATL